MRENLDSTSIKTVLSKQCFDKNGVVVQMEPKKLMFVRRQLLAKNTIMYRSSVQACSKDHGKTSHECHF